jgi:L-fuconate dehydratase
MCSCMNAGAGYDDAKVVRLTKEAIGQGFNHFKVKVGISPEDDSRRLGLVRSIIDDPANFVNRITPSAESLEGKNAGPTGCVLMMDANQGRLFI